MVLGCVTFLHAQAPALTQEPVDDVAFLGIRPVPVPEALARHLALGSPAVEGGVLVAEVVEGSAAARGQLERFDVIVRVDGEAVSGRHAFIETIRSHAPGDTIRLEVRRGQGTPTIDVQLDERPPEIDSASTPEAEVDVPGFLGVGLGEVPEALAWHLKLEPRVGIIVGDVVPDSAAAAAGVERHDLILAVDGYKVQGAADFVEMFADKKVEAEVQLELLHRGSRKTVSAVLKPRLPRWFPGPGGALGPALPDDFFFDPRGLRQSFRGRLRLRGSDGKWHHFNLEEGFDSPDALGGAFERHLRQLGETEDIDALRERLRELLGGVPDAVDPNDLDLFHSSEVEREQVAITAREGDYEVTLREENGRGTVTVRKGREVIAEDLPYDQLETLPEEVQRRVEGLRKSIQTEKGRVLKPGPRTLPAPTPLQLDLKARDGGQTI